MTGDDQTVLLVSNQQLSDNSGRAAKFNSRARQLANRGWNLQIGYVEPTLTGTITGLVRCLQLAREADIVNSVSNPPHLQIVGAIVARLTDTPWIAEFRDPLVNNPDVDPESIAATIRRRLERYIVKHADRVVWYDGIQIPDDYFENTYSNLDTSTVRKLPPIGFEKETFESIEQVDYDLFTITYAGSFYEGWIEPHTFLRGLGKYVDYGRDVQALFYGDWSAKYGKIANNSGVTDFIEIHEFIPHEEIVSVLKGSDAVLYIGGDDPRNARNIPSKLYDYIGARRPIIAIVDPSFRVAKLIRENGLGIVVEPGDEEGVANAIERIRSDDFTYEPGNVEKFTRQHSTDAYVETLESIV